MSLLSQPQLLRYLSRNQTQCLCSTGCSWLRLLWCISPANCPFFIEVCDSLKQMQWAAPSEQCGSLCPNFGTPCRNLDEIYALQKSLKTVALFIFILLQGQRFSNQEMTQRSPGLYKYRIFFIFLVNRYSTIFDYIRKRCFQCIHSSGRQEHGRQTFLGGLNMALGLFL